MLSRALGDLPYRGVGLTAEPEFNAWRTVSPGVKRRGAGALPAGVLVRATTNLQAA